MAYDMTFKNKLRKDRDDTRRAQALDEAYTKFTEPEKDFCDALMLAFMKQGLSENSAKAYTAELILFCHLKPDEQDRRIARGRSIQAEYEWSLALRVHVETEVSA